VLWEDGATVSDLRRSERTVTSRDVLTLQLSPAGGAVAMIEP
jgi:alpha-glucosidase